MRGRNGAPLLRRDRLATLPEPDALRGLTDALGETLVSASVGDDLKMCPHGEHTVRYAHSFVNEECALRTPILRQFRRVVGKIDKAAQIERQAARLRQAREHAGYEHATDAARQLLKHKTPTTYQHHENGTRGITRAVKEYANAYGVSEEWLLYGRNPPTWAATEFDAAIGAIRSMPIIDAVAAGKLQQPVSQIEGDYQTIEIGGLPAGDYFATVVDGDSMDRLSPPGSTIIVDKADRELIPGRRYVFIRRGKTTYKRFEHEPLRLVPESTNPSHEPIFPKSEDEWDVIGRVRITMLRDL